jgi:predicted amidohydrolase YtcJ
MNNVAITSRPESAGKSRLFINGNIITMNDTLPVVDAMAIRGAVIEALGDSRTLKHAYPDAILTDLAGRTVMPGIIESHGHLLSLGQSLLELNLKGAASPEAVLDQVHRLASELDPGEWIIGWGWDDGAWANEYPTNTELNKITRGNPVCLRGLHGFAGWYNDRALEIAGIDASIHDPPGGEILKHPDNGRPTGILLNEAQDLVTKHIPGMTRAQCERALKRAIDECFKHGLTSLHEARTTSLMLEALHSMADKGELKARVYAMVDLPDRQLAEYFFKKGPEIRDDRMLSVRCIKVFVDGALGSRGALMMAPYSDAPGETGVMTTSEEKLFEVTVRSLKAGLQLAVHAIGDRANRIAINAFRRALQAVPNAENPRLRVEHAQVMAPEDIPGFADLNLVVSMSPPHATSDMPWVETRIGPQRAKGAYAWRSIRDTGVHLTFNSDYPGEELNPFFGMYCAETRQTADGFPEGGWYPEQCLTREESLRAYTVEAAYSGFEENIKGQIAPGMLADFIVISDDVRRVTARQLLSMKVLQTWVGGRLVYESDGR